ncbi:MATE family efflux transporter [Paraliobacillus sediminis]|uniref:MATE family efflux transporter n=1 Tax=Paraliobacillus sediminis TaxID=1885916 RepID=UPI001967BAD0|nr:MATE family efflux transporter [Paraliobacillus sediminis]
MEMSKGLGKDFNLLSLLVYAIPTIVMMVFTAVYTMIDGIFLARFVNATALSAVNIFLPIYGLIFAIALMLGTGASAIIAKKMGENKYQEARENFTFIVICGIIVGFFIMILGLIFINPLLELLGANANKELLDLTYTYGVIMLLFSPLIILQMLFQNFFVTAGKPTIGLIITILGGVTNIVLDYVFIVPLQMGIAGAAIATGIGIFIPALFGAIYFLSKKERGLYFVKPKTDRKILLNSCLNGSSEMVSNGSFAIVTFAYNILMIKYLGVDGVAAVTIILYSMFMLESIFMGYAVGIAPIISYNFGSNDRTQLKRIFKNSIGIIVIGSLVIYGISVLLGPYVIQFLAAEGSNVYNIATDGFKIFSISFLFMGFNIFTSMLFTALSNGKVSAVISFVRTLVFVLIGLVVFPLMIGVNGIWLAVPIAEFLSLIVCGIFIIMYKKVYQYV